MIKLLPWVRPSRQREGQTTGFLPTSLKSMIRAYLSIVNDPSREMIIPETGYTVQEVVAVAVRQGFNVDEMLRTDLVDLTRSQVCAALLLALEDPHNGAFSIARRALKTRIASCFGVGPSRIQFNRA